MLVLSECLRLFPDCHPIFVRHAFARLICHGFYLGSEVPSLAEARLEVFECNLIRLKVNSQMTKSSTSMKLPVKQAQDASISKLKFTLQQAMESDQQDTSEWSNQDHRKNDKKNKIDNETYIINQSSW